MDYAYRHFLKSRLTRRNIKTENIEGTYELTERCGKPIVHLKSCPSPVNEKESELERLS